jgi:diacylglycerol kinase (ATP)
MKSIASIGILANNHAGKGESSAIAQQIEVEALRKGLTVTLLPEGKGTKTQNELKSIIEKVDALIVIGGDGSFHFVLQYLVHSSVPLYVVPTGTGNDFALTNNEYNVDAHHIIHRIIHEEPSMIDIGRVHVGTEESWFGQVLSTGFDSIVNRRANSMKLIRGQIKYTLATLLELPRFRPIVYRITTDTEILETRAMLVSVANGPTYGGGMKIVPDADRTDGYLDIMILAEVSKFELLRVFPKVFSGGHKNHPAVSFHRTKTFSLQAAALAYADGEFIGDLPIHGEIHANALLTWDIR